MRVNRRKALLLSFTIPSLGGLSGAVAPASARGAGHAPPEEREVRVPSIEGLRKFDEAIAPALIEVVAWSEDGPGSGGGVFQLAPAGIVSSDNGGTVIVDKMGRRWVRRLDNPGTITAEMFGALGNGISDDSDALQAAVDCAVEIGLKLVLEPRSYRTSRPLYVGTADGPLKSGFAIEGTSRGSLGSNGTSILLDSDVAQDAVLIWRRSAWRNGRLNHIALSSRRADGARYGLLLESSEISDIHFSDLNIENVQTAIALLQGTGKNGEFCSFRNVSTMNVETFFFSNAGQAYGTDFDHVFCYHRGGGTLIDLDPDIVGGGLILRAFNASLSDAGKPHPTVSNTTLLKLRRKHNSPVVFEGGRIEHVTCILDSSGAAQDGLVNTPIKFIGTQFTTDNVKGSSENRTEDSIRLTGTSPNLISFEQCQFTSCGGENTLFHVRATGHPRGSLTFEMCDFSGFARLPSATIAVNSTQDVTFRNCIGNPCRADDSSYSVGLPWRFARQFGPGKAVQGNLVSEAGSGRTTSRTQNLLSAPRFLHAASKKKDVACDEPWQHTGESSTLLAIDESTRTAGAKGFENTSPFARSITLYPNSGVFQDMQHLDIATPNLLIGGAKLHFVKYEAALDAGSTSGGSVRFSLGNSKTGQIYDEINYDGVGTSSTRQIVQLIACIPVVAAGQLRLTIMNAGERSATLNFAYQFVADDVDASFCATSAETERSDALWSVNLESGRFFSRLSLPCKPDQYGSTAPLRGADAEGDIYLSSDTHNLTYAAKGSWWTLQRSISSEAPPATGAWTRGDLCYSAEPKPGGYVGWVCIESGAPGTWRPFGKIE